MVWVGAAAIPLLAGAAQTLLADTETEQRWMWIFTLRAAAIKILGYGQGMLEVKSLRPPARYFGEHE